MQEENGLLPYVLAGVTAVISALAATIGVLWKNSESRNAQAISRLEGKVDSLETKQDASEKAILECEKDRSLLRGMCDFLKSKVDQLERLVGTR